jgi:lipid II:glycine glycyltransferase (peptidoglycan interpeptide bridge formation enzyme)
MTAVVAVSDTPPAGWDRLVVDAPGGHVVQGTASAAHRAAQGWKPRFVTFDDGRGALVIVRERRVRGATGYCPRGPISAGDAPELVAERAVALAAAMRAEGLVALAVDPELDADASYDRRLFAAGFREIEEIQAGRHRLVVDLPPGTTEVSLLAGTTKTARQRIRGAAAAGTVVAPSTDDADLAAFGALLETTAERKAFWIGSPSALTAWWRRVLDAGQGLLLVARNEGRVAGGLFLYRQGGHLATAYSADDPALRDELKGTMHLVRWTAMATALAEGAALIDLGTVDVPGARREPVQGEATFGLYEHKRSLGARWVESAAAHEIVLRPWRNALVQAAAKALPGRYTGRRAR